MNIKVSGRAVTITSLNVETFKEAKRYAPDLLQLRDDEGNSYFMVSVNENRAGSIDEYGIVFGSVTADNHAECTILLPEKVKAENRKKWVQETCGLALVNLVKLEQQIEEGLAEVLHTIGDVMTNITID